MAYITKTLDKPDVLVCKNGHDVTDKENALYARYEKSRGKVFYTCRACVSLHAREWRERNGSVARNRSTKALYHSTKGDTANTFTADSDVEIRLFQRIKQANETELLEIALFVAKLIPYTETPDQE
jgi:hypothetical protein